MGTATTQRAKKTAPKCSALSHLHCSWRRILRKRRQEIIRARGAGWLPLNLVFQTRWGSCTYELTALPICWNFAWPELVCGGLANTVTITGSPSSGASKCYQLLRGRVSFLQWHKFGGVYHTAGEAPLPRISRQYKWTWLEEDANKLKTIKKENSKSDELQVRVNMGRAEGDISKYIMKILE